jgi:hypothetical protein
MNLPTLAALTLLKTMPASDIIGDDIALARRLDVFNILHSGAHSLHPAQTRTGGH